MAVCEIWDVRGRLDHPIDYAENPEKTANPNYSETDLQALVDVMEYATNQDKTEQRFFVTGVNCDPASAREEMCIRDSSEPMQGQRSPVTSSFCKSVTALQMWNRIGYTWIPMRTGSP